MLGKSKSRWPQGFTASLAVANMRLPGMRRVGASCPTSFSRPSFYSLRSTTRTCSVSEKTSSWQFVDRVNPLPRQKRRLQPSKRAIPVRATPLYPFLIPLFSLQGPFKRESRITVGKHDRGFPLVTAQKVTFWYPNTPVRCQKVTLRQHSLPPQGKVHRAPRVALPGPPPP